jgi:nucleotide-binding universal stress UspA family protein
VSRQLTGVTDRIESHRLRWTAMNTILCPVDFSELSAHVLRYAATVARCGPAGVVAAYADWMEAPPYFTEDQLVEFQKQFRDAASGARRYLREFVTSTLAEGAAAVRPEVVQALPADGIRELAIRVRADLVVMGTHGRTGVNRWMLGSVAERVLRESHVPVLTVRGAAERPVKHVVCAVKDTEGSRRAVTLAAEFARCFRATLTVLHVHEEHAAEQVEDLCAWIEAKDRSRCTVREVVRHGDAATEILKFAGEESADLLVIGAQRRRFFEGLRLGTTTLRVVRHAAIPVITVPATQEANPTPAV